MSRRGAPPLVADFFTITMWLLAFLRWVRHTVPATKASCGSNAAGVK
jgi:hypothetical protein